MKASEQYMVVRRAGDTEAMWAQVREAVRTDRSPRVLGEAAVVATARFALLLWPRRRR